MASGENSSIYIRECNESMIKQMMTCAPYNLGWAKALHISTSSKNAKNDVYIPDQQSVFLLLAKDARMQEDSAIIVDPFSQKQTKSIVWSTCEGGVYVWRNMTKPKALMKN